MNRPIYLDHATTSPLLPGVFDEMTPWLTERFGDPAAGGHAYGWEAERGLETARARVADLIGADPAEIVFTSSGTEALALAVRGVAEVLGGHRRHLVVTATARDVLRAQVDWLTARGFEATEVPPTPGGSVDQSALLAAVRPGETLLVAVEAVNAELSIVQPFEAIAEGLAAMDVWMLVDGTHALGTVPMRVDVGPLPLVALAAHRFGGPKGVGALYVRKRAPRVRLRPLLGGSARERERRAGMPDVAAAVGFGVAAAWWQEHGALTRGRLAKQRDQLASRLQTATGVEVLGAAGDRAPHLLSCAFEQIEGESLVTAVPGVAFATGSSCVTGHGGSSHVLAALDRADLNARLVRLALGPGSSDEELERAATLLLDAVERLRT